MKPASLLLACALALTATPGVCHDYVTAERYSANPAHGAGVAHNVYTGCASAQYAAGRSHAPIEVLIRQCGYPVDAPADEAVRAYTGLFEGMRADLERPLAELLRPYRESYSDEQFSYFEDIDQIFATAASAEAADALLKTLEAQAIRDLGRSDGDLTVLGTISTARHSAALWAQQSPAGATTARVDPIAVINADYRGYVRGKAQCGTKCAVLLSSASSIAAAFD